MPFTCAICSLEIQIGEPMLSDEKMNLAHERCIPKEIHLPSVTIGGSSVKLPPPLPPEPPTPRETKVLAGHTINVPTEADMCVPSRRPSLCVECGKPAIGMCPACHGYVHQDYGYNGLNCSGRHEGKCEGARKFRNLDPKPIPLITADTSDYIIDVKVGRNRKNVSPKKARKGRR